METQIDYQKAINKLTLEIEEKYPELYQYLEENPITIASRGKGEFNESHLKDYYESLTQMVAKHIQTHSSVKK